VDNIVRGGERLGIHILEMGAAPRGGYPSVRRWFELVDG
jgi:hypothetical protein